MVFIYKEILLLNITPKKKDELGRFMRIHQPFSLNNFDDGYIDVYGRFKIYLPNHHRSDRSGYTFRSIVAYELYHNCIVFTDMVVHHKNEDKLDDSKENLELIEFGKHTTLHNKPRVEASNVERICEVCKEIFVIKRWRLKDPSRGKFCSRECWKNRIISEETRKKHSNSLKKDYESGKRKAWNKGKKLTEEHKRKISEGHKRR